MGKVSRDPSPLLKAQQERVSQLCEDGVSELVGSLTLLTEAGGAFGGDIFQGILSWVEAACPGPG